MPVILSLLLVPAAASAAPRFRDCGRAAEPELCRQAQQQLREEAPAAGREHGSMRNLAYCLWTGCDGAVERDRRQSCQIRRAVMKRHAATADGNDEQHFANCVRAGL